MEPLTLIVLGGAAYYLYEKRKNPAWSPLSGLARSPLDLHAALESVRAASVPTPGPSSALDPGMTVDQVKQVNGALLSETDARKLSAQAKALAQLGHRASAAALAAKATAINEARALGATDADISRQEIAASAPGAAAALAPRVGWDGDPWGGGGWGGYGGGWGGWGGYGGGWGGYGDGGGGYDWGWGAPERAFHPHHHHHHPWWGQEWVGDDQPRPGFGGVPGPSPAMAVMPGTAAMTPQRAAAIAAHRRQYVGPGGSPGRQYVGPGVSTRRTSSRQQLTLEEVCQRNQQMGITNPNLPCPQYPQPMPMPYEPEPVPVPVPEFVPEPEYHHHHHHELPPEPYMQITHGYVTSGAEYAGAIPYSGGGLVAEFPGTPYGGAAQPYYGYGQQYAAQQPWQETYYAEPGYGYGGYGGWGGYGDYGGYGGWGGYGGYGGGYGDYGGYGGWHPHHEWHHHRGWW